MRPRSAGAASASSPTRGPYLRRPPAQDRRPDHQRCNPRYSSRTVTVLGDVETRRQVINRISSGDQPPDDLLTLWALATRYFDHPDYQLEWWRPDE
ncbi:DUF6221 family protein [Streptosporangium sp. NPDC003464]